MYAILTIATGSIIRETEKAVLVELSESDNWRMWMPKSVVRIIHNDVDVTDGIADHWKTIPACDGIYVAKMPAWFAYKNGLVFRTYRGHWSVQMVDA